MANRQHPGSGEDGHQPQLLQVEAVAAVYPQSTEQREGAFVMARDFGQQILEIVSTVPRWLDRRTLHRQPGFGAELFRQLAPRLGGVPRSSGDLAALICSKANIWSCGIG